MNNPADQLRILLRGTGQRLRAARTQRNISQPELARTIGKSKQLVSAWENGVAEMTISGLLNVATALGVEPGDLLGTGVPATKCRDLLAPLARLSPDDRVEIERKISNLIDVEIRRILFRRQRLIRLPRR
jgi:transcriptional regulator with XRE-family HTH domain